jgi:guanylate kinase
MESQQGKLIVFSAPSGSGKTTIVRHLLNQDDLNLEFSISATSRQPRGKEVDGKDYHFISPEEFKNLIDRDEFVEWEEVYSDNFYGTLKSEVDRIWSKGKHAIFDIDVVGGLRVKRKFPDKTIAIFVKTPSLAEMEKRLRGRKTDSEEKIQERIAKAKKELAFAPEFDHILVNDDLETAQKKAEELLKNYLKDD